MPDPLVEIDDLRGQVARLEHALQRELEVSAEWKADARKWERRAKNTLTASEDTLHRIEDKIDNLIERNTP